MADDNEPKLMAGKNGSRGDEEGKTGLVTKTRPKTKRASLYKVLLLNDDYTPMEFVVHVLERFFNKGREEATRSAPQLVRTRDEVTRGQTGS